MSTHVKVIGVLFMIFGALWVCGAFFSTMILGVLTSFVSAQDDPGAPLGAAILGITGAALTALLLAFGIPQIICGWGLLRFKSWARILAIVLAVIIGVTTIPFGTIFAIYALVILFRKDVEPLFAA
jgi:hypothetical protein